MNDFFCYNLRYFIFKIFCEKANKVHESIKSVFLQMNLFYSVFTLSLREIEHKLS